MDSSYWTSCMAWVQSDRVFASLACRLKLISWQFKKIWYNIRRPYCTLFFNDMTTFSFSLMSKNGGFIQSKKIFIYREIGLCTLWSSVPNKYRINIDWFYLWFVSNSRFHSGLKLCPNSWISDWKFFVCLDILCLLGPFERLCWVFYFSDTHRKLLIFGLSRFLII